MAFCARARDKGLFLHVTNRRHFGHLVLTRGYNGSGQRHPELWERPRNPWEWDQQYLHPNYSRIFQEQLFQQPCPDVFQFPLFSEQFARELREEAELRGGWAEHHEVFSRALPLSSLQLELVLQGALRELLPPIARRLFPGYAPKGGGWRFPRYGCGAPAPPPGWAQLRPGRLTHVPESVPPAGTPRYGLELLMDP
ncbi:multifunctional procollagen lysine hydroxylase and glycosyltransferase LH3-like isoform X2 [Aphelocoma coerulescens]|uniref:multifunctional procollagen lysine hydroxylase and glycosyltransferase LH3-like isoform X2 n=1 Tax=Aphelocoma coerulescens TaxID=39617 RepID=UPI003604A70D